MNNNGRIGTPDVEAALWMENPKEYFIKGCLPDLHKHDHDNRWPGYRSLFQLNRDQILYSDFLMRLAGKAQILIGQRDVMVRSRLTHTLEVTQIARQLVAAINHSNGAHLNEHLCEAIALGHDLGHPPFGHMGERALNACLIELALRRALEVDIPSEEINKLSAHEEAEARHKQYICQLIAHWHLVRANPRIASKCIKEIKSKENETFVQFFVTKGFIELLPDQKGAWDFKSWANWKIDDEMRKSWEKHFLLQPAHTKVFDHYRQGIRVLVHFCATQDFSPQVLYGVGTHSGRFSQDDKKHYGVHDGNYNIQFLAAWWDNRGDGVVRPTQFEEPLICRLTGDYATDELAVVRVSDDIAWLVSDYGDAKNRIFDPKEINKLGLVDKHDAVGAPHRWRMSLVQCSDVIDHVKTMLGEKRGHNGPVISFSEKMREYRQDYLDNVATPLIYDRIALKDSSSLGMIRDLFWFYYDVLKMGDNKRWPRILHEFPECLLGSLREDYVEELYKGYREGFQERLVADILATFTDQEAMAAHSAVFTPEFQPHEHPVFSPQKRNRTVG